MDEVTLENELSIIRDTLFEIMQRRDYINKQRLREAINKVENQFKKDVELLASSGDFIINSTLVGSNLKVLDDLKKELGL